MRTGMGLNFYTVAAGVNSWVFVCLFVCLFACLYKSSNTQVDYSYFLPQEYHGLFAFAIDSFGSSHLVATPALLTIMSTIWPLSFQDPTISIFTRDPSSMVALSTVDLGLQKRPLFFHQ